MQNGQIYHYFADQEALVRAVVDYRAQTVGGETHEPVLAAIEGTDGLRAWRDMIVSLQASGTSLSHRRPLLGDERQVVPHMPHGLEHLLPQRDQAGLAVDADTLPRLGRL